MSGLFVLLCIASVPLLMWWMTVQRRRVREKMRAAAEAVEVPSQTAGTVEEERRSDGLSYGRRHMTADEVLAPDDTGGEVGGVRAIQGRR